jgi:hypothetical protein
MGALLNLMLAALLLAAFACSQAPPSIGPSLGQAVSEKPLPGNPESQNPPQLSPIEAGAEVLRLQADFAHEVPHAILHSMSSDRIWIERVRAAIEASDWTIDRPQLLVVVDRNPSVEELRIMMVAQDGPWQVIGGSKVSTGEAGRRDYYITPVGVFLHTDAILDYRAQGTFNENHIRGLGLKGMRVWDFGWQWATKGWRADKEGGDIRLLMHATDPKYLEQRIGRPASEGCVRVPATMNRFLDRHGVLDADYERAAIDDVRYRALLMPNRVPSPLAGNAMIVVDSSDRKAFSASE